MAAVIRVVQVMPGRASRMLKTSSPITTAPEASQAMT
jgi:hypothetical protein